MKKITSLFILSIILTLSGASQVVLTPNTNKNQNTVDGSTYYSRRTHVNPEFCGTDYFHNKRMASDSIYKYNHLKSIKNIATQKNPVNGIYQVPVVVHVMHKGEAVGSGTNISDEDVKLGIKYLNNYWRKISGSYGDGDGVDMKIEFTLAIQDELGNCTDGIDRVDMSGVTAYVNNGVNRQNSNGIDDYDGDAAINSLKEYSIWDPTEFYNVWIVDEIDNKNCYTGGSYTAGYAYYASQHGAPWDGSVVLICSYLDESSDTWAHEMGHAFNLPHTFDGDNGGSQCGDDGISDTPSHVRTSSITPSIYFDCTNTDANSCDASFNEVINPDNGFTRNSGTHQDHMHNYMDYTGCSSEFTGGQRTVAQSAMTNQRASFLSGYALTPPQTATVDFSAGAQVACLGGSITFYDESSCTPNTYTNTGYTGITFSWTFDNGVNTPYTSTDQNPTITFNNSGTYDVTLEITNPQGTTNTTKTGYITVSNGATTACTPPTGTNEGGFSHVVSNVTFNTINNSTSSINNITYTDYSCSQNTIVEVGQSYNLSVDYSAGNYGYAEALEVYIDWNNNGTFENPSELVLSSTTPDNTSDNASTNILIPGTATQDTLLRMRVIGEGGTISSGERTCSSTMFIPDVEDYGILVQSACTDPDVPTISGTTTICNGNNTTLSIASGNLNDASDWQWYTTSCGGTSAGNGTSIIVSPTSTTTYYVRGEGGCVTPGSCAQVTVTVNDAPSITSHPSNSTINENDNTSFSVTANNATGYQWQENTGSGFSNISNGGVYSGATTSTLNITGATLSMNGYQYRCIVSGSCTPNATSNSATLTVNPAPCNDPDVPTISGTTTICNGNNTTLSIASGNLNDATDWQWYTTSCGGTSAGNGTSIIVSPSSTTTYYVRGEGGCVTPGSCAQVTVTVNDVPGNAGAITGSNSVCENATGIGYSITAVSGATSYNWTLPTGATITAGNNTNSITVTFGTNSGTVEVTPVNACGNGGSSNLAVTVNSCAGAPDADFSGSSTSICEGNTVSFTDMSTNTPTGWNWTFQGGSPASSTNQNPSVTYNTAGTYQVSLTASNASGSDVETKVGYITVTAPNTTFLDTTELISQDCGITLTSATDIIYADIVQGAQYYQFKITNSGLGFSYESHWSNGRWINLMNIPGIQTNTTYDVQVRVRTGPCDVNSYYGNTCQVTTSGNPVPNTSIIPSLCNTTISNVNTTIYANPVSGATHYTFEVSNTSTGFYRNPTLTYRQIRLSFWLSQLQPNTTYDIKVKATVGGVVGNYSTVCQVTTPGTLRLSNSNEDEFFTNLIPVKHLEMIIYPNPNQGEFIYLELNGLQPNSELLITDISGKVIQQQFIETDSESLNSTIRFNEKLNSGFYMVTVVSGNQKTTKKLIVR